jgi:hypothetical protein
MAVCLKCEACRIHFAHVGRVDGMAVSSAAEVRVPRLEELCKKESGGLRCMSWVEKSIILVLISVSEVRFGVSRSSPRGRSA